MTWKSLKKSTPAALVILNIGAPLMAVHFGMTGAVKKKVQELQAQIGASAATQSSGTSWGITGTYFMAFHTCRDGSTSCGPQLHDTYVAQSTDSANWSSISGFAAFQGSVPDVIRKGNKLYMYNTQGVARYDMDTSSFMATVSISISSANGALDYYADPSPILDGNGKITLFYLAHDSIPNYDPAGCPASVPCTQYFRSAAEIDDSDGTQFLADPGNRAEIYMCSTCAYSSASDPDIFMSSTAGTYFLFISHGSNVQLMLSSSLKGSYADNPSLADGRLTGAGGVPAGFYNSSSGNYWVFVHSGSPAGIKRAAASSLNSSLSDSQFSVVISSSSGIYGLGAPAAIESPGFAVNSP
ncbi:MAG: hypothetical protein HY547_04535 [Elusimicrobia bacterium]|nr:hypothetical protein [Elusimicrobiota bacterium]